VFLPKGCEARCPRPRLPLGARAFSCAPWRCGCRTRPQTPLGKGRAALPPRPSASSLLRRARRRRVTFSKRQPKPAERPTTHRGGGDLHPVGLLQELAVLLQRQIGVQASLSREGDIQRFAALCARGTGDSSLGINATRLPSALEIERSLWSAPRRRRPRRLAHVACRGPLWPAP